MGILTKHSDDQGAVILGWLASSVLYARFEGTITDSLGFSVARRLTALVGDKGAVQFFCDNSRIVSFDVKAYGAVLDALLAKHDQFECIVAHTGTFHLSARTKALPDAFECFELIASDADFELRLSRAIGRPDIRDVTTLVDIDKGALQDAWQLNPASTLVAPATTGIAGERLSDSRGTVFVGWLTDGVLYSRFERTITARLAARFARRFSELVGASEAASYFSDSSGVFHYEPRAFAFISEAMLESRARFARIIVRPRTDTVATWKDTFPSLQGLEHVASEPEFVARLRVATEREAVPLFVPGQPAAERELNVLTPRSSTEAAGVSAHVPDAPTNPTPIVSARTYAFDLTNFEDGRFIAVRHLVPPAQRAAPQWACVAHSDQHAFEQAALAAFVEWAKPKNRFPEQFTVQFVDAAGGPTTGRRR